jgi:N6-L-threonylcarbamoyladenine synthase
LSLQNTSQTVILALESSCDDTSAAVIKNGIILSNVVADQEIHRLYGGVVPELASRAHESNIIPVVDAALKQAKITKSELSAVAFTRGPGLPGSLMVGVSFAKGLALALGIPLIEVHHMQAHVLAHFAQKPGDTRQAPAFPFLCLTVSGGHTQIVLVEAPLSMRILGQTLDDAAGEAFDKTAKLLGLPYPGGPVMDKLAGEGNASRFTFPHPRVSGLDFSFSGLKTSVLYFLQEKEKENAYFIRENLADLCASIQETITDMLIANMEKALDEMPVSHIALAGGVSANSSLRKKFSLLAARKGIHAHIPPFEFCTDNAGMIAAAACFKYEQGLFSTLDVTADPRLPY